VLNLLWWSRRQIICNYTFFWTNLTVEASLSSVLTLRRHLVFFFPMSVCNSCSKFLNFEKLILKYLKNVCLSSFKRLNRVWNVPSSSVARNNLCIQYFRFNFAFLLLREGKSHKQWLHPHHNDPYLRLYRLVAAHYKKDDLLNCWTSGSEVSGHHAEFHEGQCRSMAGARHGMCKLTNGMAGERHGRGMLCFKLTNGMAQQASTYLLLIKCVILAKYWL